MSNLQTLLPPLNLKSINPLIKILCSERIGCIFIQTKCYISHSSQTSCVCFDCREFVKRWYEDYYAWCKDVNIVCYHQPEPSLWSSGKDGGTFICVKCHLGMGKWT